MEELSLHRIILFFEKSCGAHFSVCDLGGLGGLSLPAEQQIHASAFCSTAKSTAKGLARCLTCKEHANRKALNGLPFEGLCAFGMAEFACPVIRGGQVLGVVYAGTMTLPEGERRRRSAAVRTGVSAARLEAEAALCPPLTDPEKLRQAVRILAELIAGREDPSPLTEYHPAVQSVIRAVSIRYMQPLTLETLAKECHMDGKYLGRLFIRQTGESFRAHLNRVRLERAAELLRRTPMTVLAIALECGFQNISYFNRLFRTAYGCTPGEYRKQ
ncbi:MAG: helix-turn-helix domain-containing protein [Oscillospiraceae bacterium]|nr:helix-turn-helix domain-containing protein [Oscillospiraceae bacterium]